MLAPMHVLVLETLVDGRPARFRQVGHHSPCAGEFFLGADGVIQVADRNFPTDPPCLSCGKTVNYRRIILMPTTETMARIALLEDGYRRGELKRYDWKNRKIMG